MRSKLCIYDVSAFVHAVKNIDMYKNEVYFGYPVGGIKYFMKFLVLDLMSGNDVVVAFDSRSFRKDLSKDYKAGRPGNLAVYSQLETLYEFLPRCGISCYKKEGYEADDLIYNIVNQNKDKYISLEIFGDDYDLTHNVDEKKVKFGAITSQVNSIHCGNFSTSIIKGEVIKFNTISAYKVFCGDKSDVIKPFKSLMNVSGKQLYKTYVAILNKMPQLNFYQIRSKEMLEWFISTVAKRGNVLLPEDIQELKQRIKIVYPVEIKDEDFTITSSAKTTNKMILAQFLTMVNDNVSLKHIRGYRSPLTEDMKNVLRKKARELETGEFAVDRNKPVHQFKTESVMINLKEF